jgi:hypothetical protein
VQQIVLIHESVLARFYPELAEQLLREQFKPRM